MLFRSVLLLRPFSKGYSLAGMRVGYGIGAPSLVAPMRDKTRDSYNVDAVAQRLATRPFVLDVSAFTALEAERKAIQTNNVEVDDRGYIYIVDRANTGMHILELTGPARKVANMKAAIQ